MNAVCTRLDGAMPGVVLARGLSLAFPPRTGSTMLGSNGVRTTASAETGGTGRGGGEARVGDSARCAQRARRLRADRSSRRRPRHEDGSQLAVRRCEPRRRRDVWRARAAGMLTQLIVCAVRFHRRRSGRRRTLRRALLAPLLALADVLA